MVLRALVRESIRHMMRADPESDEGQYGRAAPHSPAAGLLDHALHFGLQIGGDGLRVLTSNLHLVLQSHLQPDIP